MNKTAPRHGHAFVDAGSQRKLGEWIDVVVGEHRNPQDVSEEEARDWAERIRTGEAKAAEDRYRVGRWLAAHQPAHGAVQTWYDSRPLGMGERDIQGHIRVARFLDNLHEEIRDSVADSVLTGRAWRNVPTAIRAVKAGKDPDAAIEAKKAPRTPAEDRDRRMSITIQAWSASIDDGDVATLRMLLLRGEQAIRAHENAMRDAAATEIPTAADTARWEIVTKVVRDAEGHPSGLAWDGAPARFVYESGQLPERCVVLRHRHDKLVELWMAEDNESGRTLVRQGNGEYRTGQKNLATLAEAIEAALRHDDDPTNDGGESNSTARAEPDDGNSSREGGANPAASIEASASLNGLPAGSFIAGEVLDRACLPPPWWPIDDQPRALGQDRARCAGGGAEFAPSFFGGRPSSCSSGSSPRTMWSTG